MIEWLKFHTFCQALNSNLNSVIIMTHSQIKQKIKNAFQTHKNIIWKKLQSVLFNIHFFIDIWTSSNNHLLLAVTADFVDCTEEKHMKTFLAFWIVKNYNEKSNLLFFFLCFKIMTLYKSLKLLLLIILTQMIFFVKKLKLIF